MMMQKNENQKVETGVVARRSAQAGFTLVELLVVMVILGLLASLVAPNIFGAGEKARVQAARTQMSSLSTALDSFALDTGRYPASGEGLQALVDSPGGLTRWDGPYIKRISTPGRPVVETMG
jgi:general secretion pathway protein G